MKPIDKKLSELDRQQFKIMLELNLLKSIDSWQKDLGLSGKYNLFLKKSRINPEEVVAELSRSTIDVRKCLDCGVDYEGIQELCPRCGALQYKYDQEKNVVWTNYEFESGTTTSRLVELVKLTHIHYQSEQITPLPEKIRDDIQNFLQRSEDFIYAERKKRRDKKKELASEEKMRFTYFDPVSRSKPNTDLAVVVVKHRPRRPSTEIEIERDCGKWYEEGSLRNRRACILDEPKNMRESPMLEEVPPLQVCQK